MFIVHVFLFNFPPTTETFWTQPLSARSRGSKVCFLLETLWGIKSRTQCTSTCNYTLNSRKGRSQFLNINRGGFIKWVINEIEIKTSLVLYLTLSVGSRKFPHRVEMSWVAAWWETRILISTVFMISYKHKTAMEQKLYNDTLALLCTISIK